MLMVVTICHLAVCDTVVRSVDACDLPAFIDAFQAIAKTDLYHDGDSIKFACPTPRTK